MPFRPGLPLDEIIKRIHTAARPRKAMELWRAWLREREMRYAGARRLDRCGRRIGNVLPIANGQWLGWISRRGTYPQGVAWIVMTLARAAD